MPKIDQSTPNNNGGYGVLFYELLEKDAILYRTDSEYQSACRKFMDKILRMNLEVSGPGPFSPKRWILFSVHNRLYPEGKQCENLYEVSSPTDEYLESLDALVAFFRDVENTP